MKKLFALLMTGVLVFGLIGCGNKPAEPDPNVMPENMESMVAPIDSLARCMLGNKLTYDPQDPEFFWTALYYFVGGYGLDHPLLEVEENSYQLKVPTPVMQEHATVLFADYSGLYPLPSIMKGNVSYDNGLDAYFLSLGDIGLSETRLTSYEKTADGYMVTAELWSIGPEEELIRAYEVTLVDNASIDGITDPLYFYSISDIVMHEAPDSSSNTATPQTKIETTAIFNGLTDSHTVELTLPDGSVQPFQFAADSDVAYALANLEEGEGITVTYTENENSSLLLTDIE